MSEIKKPKAKNGEGSCYFNKKTGKHEHYLTSKYVNPKTLKPKRIKGIGINPKEAEKDAKQKLKKWEYEYEHDEDIRPDKTKTFGEYMKEYLLRSRVKGIAGSTFKSYNEVLGYAFYKKRIAKFQLQMLNVKVFENYYNTIAKNYCKSNQVTIRSLMVGCVDWLIDRGLMTENYADKAKTDKEVKDEYIRTEREKNPELAKKEVLTDEDILTIYNAMKREGINHKYYACYVLQLETFIRSEELVAIRLDDIDYEKKIVYLRSAIAERYKDNEHPEYGYEKYEKVPKGKEERYAPLSEWALEAIEQLKLQLELKCKYNPHNLLICNYKNGDFVSSSSYRHMWHEACDDLGIIRPDKFGPHKAFRHTGVTFSATREDDANLKNIALVAGHKDARTQAGYIHETEKAVEKVASPLGILNKENVPEQEEQHPATSGLTEQEERQLYELLKKKFENE